MLHKAWNSKGEMLYCFPRSSIEFQGHTVQNITNFYRNWAFPDYWPVAAFKSLRFALFGMGLQDQIWNLLYLSQKWFDCHETKSKHIDWTLGPKWDHRVDRGHDLDLEFSRSNMEFAISQPKMVWLPRNKKQTYRLNTRPQMWPSGLTLTMTLTLNFHGQIWNFLYLCQKWSGCHETNSKHIN